MVGSRLVIFINSDTEGAWWGHLLLSRDDGRYGTLSGRGYNEQRGSYDGSHLPAAAEKTWVQDVDEPNIVGLLFTVDSKLLPANGSLSTTVRSRGGFAASVWMVNRALTFPLRLFPSATVSRILLQKVARCW